MLAITSYKVKKKPSTLRQFCEDVSNYIKSQYPDECGIIYCATRQACETLSDELEKNYGLNVSFFHAGLKPAERTRVQQNWQSGKIKVLAATIAFGMGINKADVRFVIHHSIPSSVEGYYQETGRAGRDGLPSECILYYSYRDTMTQRYLIDTTTNAGEDAKNRRYDNLNKIIRFCENRIDCRRQQILAYFSEDFDAKECRGTCDNCQENANKIFEERDMTAIAKDFVDLVQEIQDEDVSLSHVVSVFAGSNAKRILERGHQQLQGHGKGKGSRDDLDRLSKHLIFENVLYEKTAMNSMGFTQAHVKASDLYILCSIFAV